jgi:serine/threonine protein kinase
MSLNPGTKLGPYEVLAPLGAGGMGEVYKATDTRLDRTVAVKVLPSHLSDDPRLKERFEREARAVSSLNHPHICALYDIGRETGIDFMVMEHIQGDTLADRLKKGPLPLDSALQYGSEVAGALDKAHRQGVVHRDLKPGNIMITKSGAKLLDFGLAKTTAQQTNAASLSALPTKSQPLTEEGSILGTFQYMAPEQLDAKQADNRTDIFAFGAVLYEMVTGKRAFEGESQASLIAAILNHDPPPVREARETAPPALTRVVEVCLAKDPDERWQSMADVARQLRWFVEGREETDALVGKAPSQSLRAFAIPEVVTILLAALAAWWIKPVATAPDLSSRLTIALPPGVESPQAQARLERNIAISPNGRLLVYVANRNGTGQLFLRPLDQFEATPIPGTEEGFSPFFSPDGNWIGFFTLDKLQKIPVEGGIPVKLASVSRGGGGNWGPNGEIVFTSADSGLLKISEGGGEPETLRPLEFTSVGSPVPHILPDGKHVVYTEGIGPNLKICGWRSKSGLKVAV